MADEPDEPVDQTSAWWLAAYLTSWVVCLSIGALGTMLHMALALDGPAITYFGYDAGTGLSICTVVTGAGFVGGLISRAGISEKWRWMAAGVALSVVSGALMLSTWRTALAWSWESTCDRSTSYVCNSLGELWEVLDRPDRSPPAHRTACRGGSAQSCGWLLEEGAAEKPARICERLEERCRTWQTCRDSDPGSRACQRHRARHGRFHLDGMNCDVHDEHCVD